MAQERKHLAIFATALALVLVQHGIVENFAEDLRLARDVLVAAVSRPADDDQAPLSGHAFDGLHQRPDRVGVVAVVCDDGGAAIVKHVEAARCGGCVVDEGGKARFDGEPVDSQCPDCRNRGHRVFDLEDDRSLAGERNGR